MTFLGGDGDVLQDDIGLGLLSSTVARELARLPRGNQVPMAATIRGRRASERTGS